MTQAEYARLRGCSQANITQLKKAGRLVLNGDGLIDVEASNSRIGSHSARIRPVAMPEDDDLESQPEEKTVDYWAAKAKREAALAEIAELDLEKKRSELVNRGAVERALFNAGRTMRDTMMAVPARIAAEVAVLTDPFAVERTILAAIRQALEDAIVMSDSDFKKAMESASD